MENFSFINPNNNDKLSYLRGIDLQELIVEVENYYLEYRDTLNFPSFVTFGTEIEYEEVPRLEVDRFVREKLKDWNSFGDASLTHGGEVTSPVMHDELSRWKELQVMCKFLNEKKAIMFRNAGGHIHIGAHVLGNDISAWKRFFKTYAAYESVIFRFAYGDKVCARKRLFEYAYPISDEIYNNIESISEIKKVRELPESFDVTKYKAVNFSNVVFEDIKNDKLKNTIEFRMPNATYVEVIWQNNINAFCKFMLACKNGLIDEEMVDYKFNYERISPESDYSLYNVINLRNVLEFVDLIFDNNLDKVYFLRQYLKGFQEKGVEAKRFVR